MDKQVIKIDGAIQKEDCKEFTQKERDLFYDKFLEFIESNNFLYGGWLG